MEKDIYFQRIYAEICLGYSEKLWKNSKVYIKHLSNLDGLELDSYYEQILDDIKKNGIRTYDEKIKWLTENKIWDVGKEITINQQKDYLDSLQKTYDKLIFKSQKTPLEKTIQEESRKLGQLLEEKENLIGTTAERIANNKIQFYYFYVSFFQDKKLDKKLFNLEEINNLDDDDSYELLRIYNENVEKFDSYNLKKIAISNYFTNNFYICGEHIQSFFGKPVYLLTNYQSSLLGLGMYFKNVFMNNQDLPEKVRNDPDKIEEFIKQSQGFKEMLSKIDPNAQSIGIVANKSDFEERGLIRDTSFINSKGPSVEK